MGATGADIEALVESLSDYDMDALLAKAKAAFDALPPAEQEAMRAAQRDEWVWAELALEGTTVIVMVPVEPPHAD